MQMQDNLFDDLPVDPYLGQSKDSLSLVITLPKLGAQQKLFNDLLAKIAKVSRDVEALKQLEAEHRLERDGKLRPIEQEAQVLHEKFVLVLDQRLQTPKGLSKKQLADMGYVAAVIADSLDAVADMRGKPLRPEIQVVVDRLCAVLEAEEAEDGQYADPRPAPDDEEAMAELKRMMSQMAGVEFEADFGTDAQTPEELMEMVMRKISAEREADQQAHQARRANQKKSPKQQLAEQETLDAESALRTIYRKLASALHPDREPDEAERVRKTQLMGQVNAANDAKDLLTLLRLQLQIEQINPLAIAQMADDKLRHYNRMLQGQVKTVQETLLTEQYRLRQQWQLGYGAINIKTLQTALRGQLHDLNVQNAYMQQDLQMIQDDKYLKSWVKDQIRQLAASQASAEHWL